MGNKTTCRRRLFNVVLVVFFLDVGDKEGEAESGEENTKTKNKSEKSIKKTSLMMTLKRYSKNKR